MPDHLPNSASRTSNLLDVTFFHHTGRFMNRHFQQLIEHGIPEEEFLIIADSHVWVRRRATDDLRGFVPALPHDVMDWPKSEKLEDVADHLVVLERAFGISFRRWRNHYLRVAADPDYQVVHVEALMGHLLARAIIINRLARFLRGVGIIELRADAKRRANRHEVTLIDEAATAYRKRIGFLSTNPVHRITTAVRRSRLSKFQARNLASTEPRRLHVVRVDNEGTTTVVGINFLGEHRYGKWSVGSGDFDKKMLITRQAKTIEVEIIPESMAEVRCGLSQSSLFLRPESVPALLEEIRHCQQEAITIAEVRSNISDRDRAEHDQSLAYRSHLIETQRLRDEGRKRRNQRRERVVGHYRRWLAQSTRRLLETGMPAHAEEATFLFD